MNVLTLFLVIHFGLLGVFLEFCPCKDNKGVCVELSNYGDIVLDSLTLYFLVLEVKKLLG